MVTKELWQRYKEKKDKNAKDDLIVAYVELVKIIAGRLFTAYNSKVEYDDLVGYGIIGLIDAIEKFDHTKDVKFETYANIRIRGAIVDQLRSFDWVPRTTRQKYKELEKAIKKLNNSFGDSYEDADIAKEMGISVDEYYEVLSEVSSLSIMSLDEKVSENSNFSIKDEDIDGSPEKKLLHGETKKILVDRISKLPEKEKLVVSLYYYDELTYKEIAEVLGVSESRISQIHSKAIAKLQIGIEDLY